MQHVKKYLNGEFEFLELSDNDDDIQESEQLKNEKNLALGLNNIQQLVKFPKVERLIITSGTPMVDVSSVLEKLTSIRELKLDYIETEPDTEWTIDISRLAKLEYLFSRSSNNFKKINNSKSLKTLIVFNWYSDNLENLRFSSIDSLSICGGRLKTLSGIEEIPLKILSLSRLNRLVDISQIKGSGLIMFEMDNCNKVNEFEKNLPATIEYLMVYGKNKVMSIGDILIVKALKRVILDIPIENGDLSELDSLERAVLLTDDKKYNRCDKQLPKAEETFDIPSIPSWRYIYKGRRI